MNFHWIPEWQLRRTNLNHDWLKNRYINRLKAAIQRLRERDSGSYRTLPFFSEDLREWEIKRGEVTWLVENFEVQMSPKVLFNREPLSNVDAATMVWLPNLIHALWVSKYRISAKIDAIKAAMAVLESKYTEIASMEPWRWENVPVETHSLLDIMQEFDSACEALSRSLSDLPKDILFT